MSTNVLCKERRGVEKSLKSRVRFMQIEILKNKGLSWVRSHYGHRTCKQWTVMSSIPKIKFGSRK
jgi:hypothetical protein